ncbi:metal ABC transporter permease [Clostridium estertheticum]|uniref:metal ABC transporter permease n=1 Tax=Clostridium estertheticum TaxID=238834 RepID=UPI0013E91867|nr:metal ABC transporter permease [Clostridium estertheticum]MBZ9686434.1 metal ABC transporter permease [Clostridium estertheticum]
MSLWYNIVNFLLPFDWAHYTFMKNALLGVLLVTPMFGLLGTMVVNNKMAFFSDALGHSALTGIAIGVILGIKNPIWSMLVFSLMLAVVITKVKNVNTSSTDTIIGVFSSTAVALGVVMLSYGGGFTKYSVYLIGDLLSISQIDLLILPIIFVIVVIIWVIAFNKLLLVSVNPLLARSRGINVNFYEYLFTITVAIIVTISIQWVGVLIISSMLVLPAAAARNISSNMRQYHIYSIAIALISGVTGLILSYFLGSASGATMVLIASMFFGITFFMKLKLYS